MLFSCIKLIQTFQNDLGGSSTQSSLFIQNSISVDYPLYCNPYCTNILSQFSILAMIYFIMGSESLSPTFLVTMSSNCRPPSHHSILCILQFSPFHTKCNLLEMCLVLLISLPFLAIKTANLLSNIIRGAYYRTISGSLFNNL